MYYAAEIAYVLRDMRPCVGPFANLAGATVACLEIPKYRSPPREPVEDGDWFAVHGPGELSMVDGPYKSRKKANAERIKNKNDNTIGNGAPGFVAKVVHVARRHKNGIATHIVLQRRP